MVHPAIYLWMPNLVGGTKLATTQRESFASRRKLDKRGFWFTQVEWMQCGGCQNQPYHVALRPGSTATSIQSWCKASGSGNGVGRTPKKIFWRKRVACYRSAWRAEREKKCRFENTIPCKLQENVRGPPDFPRENSSILMMKINSFAVAKTTFKIRSKRSNALFPTGYLL